MIYAGFLEKGDYRGGIFLDVFSLVFCDKMRNIIEPNLISKIQKNIDKKTIFLVSSENNDNLFNLENYSILEEFDIDARSNLKLRSVYILVPNICLYKINS